MQNYNLVMDWLANNWLVPLVIAIVLLWFVAYKVANKHAKTIAEILLWKAEEVIFDTLDNKFEAISEVGYELLPPFVRIVLSKKAFLILVQKSYGEVKLLVHKFDGTVKASDNAQPKLPSTPSTDAVQPNTPK